MRKRVFPLFVVGTLVTGLLAGCGSNPKEQESDPVVQSEQTTGEKELEKGSDVSGEIDIEDTAMEEIENDKTDGKTIVVYFSATGNTEQVATVIAEAIDGELFVLEPVEPYTDADLDWTDEKSRVGREYGDPEQRDVELVSTAIDGWKEASTVYIGFCVWCMSSGKS